MALGQFLMFVSACIYTSPTAYWLMFAGLGLLILGNGFFKPNISTMVGDLYAKNDSRATPHTQSSIWELTSGQ